MQGEWKMIDHQSYSFSEAMGPSFFPFDTMKISNDSVWIDGELSKMKYDKDSLSFKINGQLQRFKLSDGNTDRIIFLSSKKMTPLGKNGSFYYFERIK